MTSRFHTIKVQNNSETNKHLSRYFTRFQYFFCLLDEKTKILYFVAHLVFQSGAFGFLENTQIYMLFIKLDKKSI